MELSSTGQNEPPRKAIPPLALKANPSLKLSVARADKHFFKESLFKQTPLYKHETNHILAFSKR